MKKRQEEREELRSKRREENRYEPDTLISWREGFG